MKVSWTIVSIVSRLISVAIGIVQSYIILSLLSQPAYGLVKIVTSVVAMAGVLQNLGISSGSTREISAAKSLKDAGKVFTGSLIVRYLMSLPVALVLIFWSGSIAKFYNSPDIVFPLQIFGAILLIQAAQATLTSLIQGLHKFAFLFIQQIGVAFLSLCIHIFFLYRFTYLGYFYAQFWFTLISTLILGVYGVILLYKEFEFPRINELYPVLKSVFKIGIAVYFIKIIVTQWENIGPLVIGKIGTPAQVAIFSTALFIATKVVTISDAVTDVTLPKNTKIFENERERFGEKFNKSNTKAYILILFSAIIVILAKKELFMILDFVLGFISKQPISEKYASSFVYVDPLVIAFWAYSHLNLLKSGVSVPAFRPLQALYIFIFLMVTTLLLIVGLTRLIDPNFAVAFGMMISGLATYILYLVLIKKTLGFVALSQYDVQYSFISTFTLVLHYLVRFPSSNLVYLAIFSFFSIYFIYRVLKLNES